MELALIDIDGPIACNKKREAYANDIVDASLKSITPFINEKTLEQARKEYFYSKDAFYNERLILEDSLVPRSKEDIHALWQWGWQIKYLTSRPDFLQEVTAAWMLKHGLTDAEVYCKNIDAFQYVRSDLWKMGVAEILIKTLNVSRLLFIDDEKKNRMAVLALAAKYKCTIHAFDSLVSAADYVNSPDEDGNW